ncbi:YihY/virulence factor BrkB family protein [Frigoribacterium salinisoli]
MATLARVAGTRPVRTLGRYVGASGPLLAGGLTYQALFALFAALWVGFSVAGVVVSGDAVLREQLVELVRSSVPGLVEAPDGTGVVDPDLLLDASVFGWTGAVAGLGLLGSAVVLLGSTRTAVRTMFRAPAPATPFVHLVLRDLALALAFGVAVLASAIVSLVSTTATSTVLGALGVDGGSLAARVLLRLVVAGVLFVLDTAVLVALYRVLAGLHVPRRRLLAGALLGAAAVELLKLAGGLVLGAAGSNPLVASFAAVIGLLVVLQLLCQVLLLGAAWIAIGMDDVGVLADPVQEAERLRREEEARRAAEAAARTPWARARRVVAGAAEGLRARLGRRAPDAAAGEERDGGRR